LTAAHGATTQRVITSHTSELLSGAPLLVQQEPFSGPAAAADARLCQVPGCGFDLGLEFDSARAVRRRLPYHVRFRLCLDHVRAESVLIAGAVQRWCQKCSRFHAVSAFEGDQRTCALQLRLQRERNKRRGAAGRGSRSGGGASRKKAGAAAAARPGDSSPGAGAGGSTHSGSSPVGIHPGAETRTGGGVEGSTSLLDDGLGWGDDLDLDFLLEDGMWPLLSDPSHDPARFGLSGVPTLGVSTAHVKLHGGVTPHQLSASGDAAAITAALGGWLGPECLDSLVTARPGCTLITVHALVTRPPPQQADQLLRHLQEAATARGPGSLLGCGLTTCDPDGRVAAANAPQQAHSASGHLPRMRPAAVRVPLSGPLHLRSVTPASCSGTVALFVGGRPVGGVTGCTSLPGRRLHLQVPAHAVPPADGIMLLQLEAPDGALAVGPVQPVVLCTDAAVVREVASLAQATEVAAHAAALAIGFALSGSAPPAVVELAARVAATRGWEATLRRVLRDARGGSPPAPGLDTLLHAAVRGGNAACVSLVRAACPELLANQAGGQGRRTAMHLAAALPRRRGREAVLQALAHGDDTAAAAWLTCVDTQGRTPEAVYQRTRSTEAAAPWLPGTFPHAAMERAWLDHTASLLHVTDLWAYPFAGLGHSAQAVSVWLRGYGAPDVVHVTNIALLLTLVPLLITFAPATFLRHREAIHVVGRFSGCVLPLWVHHASVAETQQQQRGVTATQNAITLVAMSLFSTMTMIRVPLHAATQLGSFAITIGMWRLTHHLPTRVLAAALNLCSVIVYERASRQRFVAKHRARAQKVKAL
jgi:hypothetical protein